MDTTRVRGAAGATMDDIAAPSPRPSHDLARSQGTDFFAVDDLLTTEERSIRARRAGQAQHRRRREAGVRNGA